MSNRRIIVALSLAFVTGLVSLGASAFYCNPGFTPVTFTPEGWAKADAERRGHMTDSLLASHDLRGMSPGEVIALLCPPDDDQADIRRFRYHLGRRGRHPDCPLTDFSLLIRFDAAGKAISADIAD